VRLDDFLPDRVGQRPQGACPADATRRERIVPFGKGFLAPMFGHFATAFVTHT